jgi:hypothetical protein
LPEGISGFTFFWTGAPDTASGTRRVTRRGEIFIFDGSGTTYDDSRFANGNAIPGILGV